MPDDAGTSGQVNLPNGGQVSTSEETPQEKSGAMQSWLNTATTPKPQTESMPAGAAAPQLPTQAPQQMQVKAVPVTSMKRGGFLGVMDGITDALVGKQRPELGKDPDGNVYIKQHTLTRGEQWMRIAGEAITGAEAGFAAGKGAGNMSKAPLAGAQAQQAQADRQAGQMDKAVLDSANHQMQQMKMAELTWQATRLQGKAMQEDEDWADKKRSEMEASHAVFLGTTTGPGDIAHLKEAHPGLMKSLVGYKGAEQDLQFVPKYENGKAAGFDVYKKRPGYGATMLPDGAVFHSFDPATGETQEHHATGPISQGEIDELEMAYYNKKKDYENNQIEQDLKKSQTDAEKAKASESPSEIEKNRAEAQKARSESEPGAGTGPVLDDISEGLASGRYLMGKDIPLRTSKDQTAAATYNKAADDYSRAHYGLPYSPETIRQESHFAQQPHVQAYLNSIDRMIGTPGISGQLDQVLDLAKRAGVTEKGGGLNVPFSQLKQIVRQKLGDDAAKNLETGLSDTQTALGTLIGNPLLGGGESDLKLKTAQAQYGKNLTISDLESTNRQVKEILDRARQQMARNNRYIQQRYGDAYSPAPLPGAGAGWAPPAGAPAAPQENNKYLYDPQGKPVAKSVGGKWVQP